MQPILRLIRTGLLLPRSVQSSRAFSLRRLCCTGFSVAPGMRTLIFVLGASATACVNATDYAAATGADATPREVEINDYKDALALFDELGYTSEAWQSGIRVVPRIYLAEISDQWSKKTTLEIDVKLKKKLFFRAIGPLALRSNEIILQDRKKLQGLLTEPDSISAAERGWVDSLAQTYGLDPTAYKNTGDLQTALLPRVDAIPPSLVLAQAAEESGWGTSRFAFSGNALFGQWTWGDKGIRPQEQRGGRGDYKIAAFDAPLQSVQAHALNLNTHSAYLQFRIKRAQLRADTGTLSGYELAGSLTSYSERGLDYVKTLRSIISYNKLEDTDVAYLNEDQPIVLIPTANR
jgi:Bax protein